LGSLAIKSSTGTSPARVLQLTSAPETQINTRKHDLTLRFDQTRLSTAIGKAFFVDFKGISPSIKLKASRPALLQNTCPLGHLIHEFTLENYTPAFSWEKKSRFVHCQQE
jgi:hypothetical protein